MDFSTIQRLWPDVVEAVKQKSRATWMVIMAGVQPVSLDGKVLTLGFDAEGRRLGFVNGGRDAVLREVFKERMGVDWRIETVVGGAPSGSPPGEGRALARGSVGRPHRTRHRSRGRPSSRPRHRPRSRPRSRPRGVPSVPRSRRLRRRTSRLRRPNRLPWTRATRSTRRATPTPTAPRPR
ncbi:hypothetical protein ACFQY7_38965 [Actinomadura luteofluorescens]|uniref:hypothetical protein n=1 Tax=Actinomadura luteofluorescens TaxID=46163 RepID=UPI00362A9F37